jgi:hypothetical protein
LEGHLRHIRTGRGKRTGCAKLLKIQGAIALMRFVPTNPVVSREETKIVASLSRIFPVNREVAA